MRRQLENVLLLIRADHLLVVKLRERHEWINRDHRHADIRLESRRERPEETGMVSKGRP